MEYLAIKADITLEKNFWKEKRVLVTGHSGFKGSWLTIWLSRLGAHVYGISLPPITKPNLFTLAEVNNLCISNFCDINKFVSIKELVKGIQPEIVFHLAAQPLVLTSYRMPVETFSTNIMGTIHMLESFRSINGKCVAIMVTTDKVYKDNNIKKLYDEDDPLGGYDPYSASKAASEIVISSYRDSFLKSQGIAVASARAGNVLGGGDWSEDRLIPDAVRAWQEDKPLNIRNPDSIRPWQFILEPLYGYLTLAEKLWLNPSISGAFNFGPDIIPGLTVLEVVEKARAAYGRGRIIMEESGHALQESEWLSLNVKKTYNILGIKSLLTTDEAIVKTMSWYAGQNSGEDALKLCTAQIEEYENRS